MYNVHFLDSAKDDMLKIADYITNDLYNPTASMNLIEKLEQAKNSLKEFPTRHPKHESGTTKKVFRKMLVDNYILFYIIEDSDVYIAFVLHQKQDFDYIVK